MPGTAQLSSKNRDGGASPGVSSCRRFGVVLTILCGRGAEDKRKATGSILGYRVLQIEGFERNVAARAVGADVFEIAVGEPVVSHGTASAIVQRQQEDSLAQGLLFGRRAERGSGGRRRIPFCCVVIRRLGGGQGLWNFRAHGAWGIWLPGAKRGSAE